LTAIALQVQQEVLDGLRDGSAALEKANAVFSIDEIESIMSDTEEAVDKQREIERMLSGGLSEVIWLLHDVPVLLGQPCNVDCLWRVSGGVYGRVVPAERLPLHSPPSRHQAARPADSRAYWPF
jgi:hypothetical protein